MGPQTNHLRTLFFQIYIRRPHRVQVQIASFALEENLTSYNWTTKMTLAFLAMQMSSKTIYKACVSRLDCPRVIAWRSCCLLHPSCSADLSRPPPTFREFFLLVVTGSSSCAVSRPPLHRGLAVLRDDSPASFMCILRSLLGLALVIWPRGCVGYDGLPAWFIYGVLARSPMSARTLLA